MNERALLAARGEFRHVGTTLVLRATPEVRALVAAEVARRVPALRGGFPPASGPRWGVCDVCGDELVRFTEHRGKRVRMTVGGTCFFCIAAVRQARREAGASAV